MLVRRESGAGLGVEPEDLLVLEISQCLPEFLPERVDHLDLAGKGRQFQAADLFRTNRYLEHTGRYSFGRRGTKHSLRPEHIPLPGSPPSGSSGRWDRQCRA